MLADDAAKVAAEAAKAAAEAAAAEAGRGWWSDLENYI